MELNKSMYNQLLRFVGHGDFENADIIILGNEEGAGGNTIADNLIKRCEKFGRNETGEYINYIQDSDGELLCYWQKDDAQKQETMHDISLQDEDNKKFEKGGEINSKTKYSKFLSMCARMKLALANLEDTDVNKWYKNLGKDKISDEIRVVASNHLFTEEYGGIRIAMIDWRPLLRKTEKDSGNSWPKEYSNITESKYRTAFDFGTGKQYKDKFSDYKKDAEIRKTAIASLLKAYPGKIIIGYGAIEIKQKILENIFEGCKFSKLDIENESTNKSNGVYGYCDLEEGRQHMLLLPFPIGSNFGQGKMYPYYSEVTSKYLVPIIRELNRLDTAEVEVNDYKNSGKKYTEVEKKQLKHIAEDIKDKDMLYERVGEIALKFRRTEVAICKQIEQIKEWHWTPKGDRNGNI